MKTNDPFSMDISRHIWETRYRAAGEADIRASWRRVAWALAAAESDDREGWAERFLALLDDFRFLPGGRRWPERPLNGYNLPPREEREPPITITDKVLRRWRPRRFTP